MIDVFDRQELLDEMDGDREFLAELLEILKSDAPTLLGQLREALERGDAESLSTIAHTLKSMVGNLFAQPAFNAALDVEKIGRGGDLTECSARLDLLETEVSRLQKALHEFLGESK